MKHKLNLDTWERKEHFNFFKTFEEPYYGVTVNIDCTAAYNFTKTNGHSFFLYYMHKSLAAAQAIEQFKYRIEGDEVFVHDQIDAGSTIGRSNGTFGFGHIIYYPTFKEFETEAKKEIADVQSRTDLIRTDVDNIIRFSALPWINFTSISHARAFAFPDSCPKISFGKMTDVDGKKSMPVSIHVHHALVDGLHVGQFIDRFQQLMNSGA
ncbi:chloramphenicol O-acetyltransferase type A [Mucilaginibacter pineti]|uniref:Chloramphenicol O-acetyltransferase type A n=1 Tax=Mucilaginibacter pineti TaxID=1391627 RepID=A0A1G6TEB7_9SPHI|nr:chloramphenicol acetyltransferase [Mucilaginibacter pineti]SDD26767.1 chloramphenicol O-acetyltransferase type A [Mucilaginibacter pineti]